MIYKALFLKSKHKKFQDIFASSKKKSFQHVCDGTYCPITVLGMTRTVLLHCPIKAEIRAVDSQSDLRILL